jgi:PAS domain S-box-containing protein
MPAHPAAERIARDVAHRLELAERWQRAITQTGAVPYSAAEIHERLLELVDVALGVVEGVCGYHAAVRLGSDVVRLGFRSPEALGATVELFNTTLAIGLDRKDAAAVGQRCSTLIGGLATGFSAAVRRQLLDEQEASRAAVMAENRRAWDALKRQAALLDLAPDAIIVRHVGTNQVAFWNHGAETLYGWSRHEAVGEASHVLLQTRSADPLDEIEARLLLEGHWQGELVHTRRDGSRLTVSSRWALQFDAHGQPAACLEINTDITAREQMEAALREREATLEKAQSVAHLGSWEWNPATDTVFWSAETYRLLGYAEGAAVRPSREALDRAVHPHDAARAQQALDDALTSNKSYTYEIRTAALDGVERTLACQNELVRDADGRVLKVVGTALDITERKRAEAERLKLSAMEAARTQAEAARQRVAFLADASRVLASSIDYATTLQNVTEVAVPGLADVCLLHMIDDDGELCRAAATGDRDGPATVEPTERQLRGVQHAGEPRWAPSSLLVPLVSRTRTWGIMTFLAGPDRHAYSELDIELATELAGRCELAIENARLHAEAQRATRLRDEFLSVAAHELKTPMTTLRGYAQWLLRALKIGEEIDPALLDRGLRAIDIQSAKLVDLTAQLLDVSRIEAGKLRLERREVDLVSLVRAAVEAGQALTQVHTLTLDAPRVSRAMLDPLRLEQVVRNLIDNAIKYSPQGGSIEVELGPAGRGKVRLVVRDHGLGIPPERRESLFDRFYQAHGDGHFGGLGLGLYISRQIVELHGGRIAADFPSDGGSRFEVILPTKVQPARNA